MDRNVAYNVLQPHL